MKISTSNIIAGEEIIKHKSLVKAIKVTSLDVFISSYKKINPYIDSDVSGSNNRINLLYDDLIIEIQKQAFELGANAIIDLKFDISDISDINAKMILITCLGTAVVTKKGNSINDFCEVSGALIKHKYKEMGLEQQIVNAIEKAEKDKKRIYYSTLVNYLEKIKEDNLNIHPKSIFNLLFYSTLYNEEKFIDTEIIENKKDLFPLLLECLVMYSNDTVLDSIYSDLYNIHQLDNSRFNRILKDESFIVFMRNNLLPNYTTISKYIDIFDYVHWEKLFFPLLLKYDMKYNENSIIVIKEISSKIESREDNLLPILEVKESQTKWICTCGRKNAMKIDVCPKCQTSKFGYKTTYKANEKKVVDFLNAIISIYSEINCI